MPRLAYSSVMGLLKQITRRIKGRGGWAGRIRLTIAALIAVFVIAPFGLALIYRVAPVPATPLMVLRVFEGEGWSKTWVALDEISPYLPMAVVAAEDNRFCEHHGFDVEAIRPSSPARGWMPIV